jgi:hypothetical protein
MSQPDPALLAQADNLFRRTVSAEG